jgi:hypothetical protein
MKTNKDIKIFGIASDKALDRIQKSIGHSMTKEEFLLEYTVKYYAGQMVDKYIIDEDNSLNIKQYGKYQIVVSTKTHTIVDVRQKGIGWKNREKYYYYKFQFTGKLMEVNRYLINGTYKTI